MTTLFLVRHGETIDNALQLMQGQVQGELNAKGIAQAETVAEQLKDEHFDAIISSDLHRAIQTAEIIALPHRLTVVTTPLLRERDWGDFTGRYIPDLKGLPFPENTEKMEHLLERAGRFLDYIRTNYPEQRVLAVGHGIMNKAVQAVLLGKQTRDIVRMENAEVRIFNIE